MRQELNLKEVYWGRLYPMQLENEELVLVRKNYGFRLIYEVFCNKTGESLGTCHILEKVNYKIKCKNKQKCSACKCENAKFVVRELVAKSPKLTKRLGDIQGIVYERF